MSVEAQELISHEWTRWQGHVINDLYPLGRILGCTERSSVFLTRASDASRREVAIKLIPASREHGELQLRRWSRVTELKHPNLLPLMEHGLCELEGLPYLYVVMERAEQTLAQLLLQRALTVEEVRETLPPILDALAFLHSQDLIHGQLKPANILVVGDQLKLASDKIRHLSDVPLSLGNPSLLDSPESRDGSSSTSMDIWSLGLTLYEAILRRLPAESALYRSTISLPTVFPSELLEVVAGCLSHKPRNRPNLNQLRAWSEGGAFDLEQPTASAPVILERPGLEVSLPLPPQAQPSVLPEKPHPMEARLVEPAAATVSRRTPVIATIVAVSLLAIGWVGIKSFGSRHSSDASNMSAVEDATSPAAPTASTTTEPRSGVGNPSSGKNQLPSVAVQPLVLHEVMPEVTHSATHSIRGHVKVSLRASVSPDGSVSSVAAERGNPSKYFQRVALDAARKWKFLPAQGAAARQMLIQFSFGRDGTTANATAAN